MTVRELVMVAAKGRNPSEEAYMEALSSLGLWDAEVLEMNATSGPGWMDLMEPVGEGEPLDLPEGRVRFIVLPKEEECK